MTIVDFSGEGQLPEVDNIVLHQTLDQTGIYLKDEAGFAPIAW